VPKLRRDDFSRADVNTLRTRVAGFCSRPECRKMTIAPDPRFPLQFSTFGRAAHITAAAQGGPRYDESLTSMERKSIDNGIWLCADCADLIDKNHGNSFSVELLRTWKMSAERDVYDAAVLNRSARPPRWMNRLGIPFYVNLPRVLCMDENLELSEETSRKLHNGFPRNEYIYEYLSEVRLILRRSSIYAVDIEQLLFPKKQAREGLIVSFSRGVRTKNGKNTTHDDVARYDFNSSPLFYTDLYGARYIFPYDPKWLTTTTAMASMQSGNITFSGIGLVKINSESAKEIIVSPLTFGVPDILGLCL